VIPSHEAFTRDKYEVAASVPENVRRRWEKCLCCGLFVHKRNYDASLLNTTYEFAYRSEDFREHSIQEEYHRIRLMPEGTSENLTRVRWLVPHLQKENGNVFKPIERKTVLDIGSGLGVFPEALKNNGFVVTTIEANHESAEFLATLGMNSLQGFFPESKHLNGTVYDIVTAVHVLEHQKHPEEFLRDIHAKLKLGGTLFIEVPDMSEFMYLDPAHDEFASTHLWCFDPSTLCRLIEDCGFQVMELHRQHYQIRDLSRIFLLARRS
jgi:SAM-dependent methyltransferase